MMDLITTNVMSGAIPVRVAVAAYIIRQNSQREYELLLFQHPDCNESPLQIPGGGVDPDESLETALHREIWEESGLTNLRVIRKLGVAEFCWIQPLKLISQRHIYLLAADRSIPDQWDHTVLGDGFDAGMVFSYFWHRPDRTFSIPYDLGYFLNPQDIPELYCPRSPESTL